MKGIFMNPFLQFAVDINNLFICCCLGRIYYAHKDSFTKKEFWKTVALVAVEYYVIAIYLQTIIPVGIFISLIIITIYDGYSIWFLLSRYFNVRYEKPEISKILNYFKHKKHKEEVRKNREKEFELYQQEMDLQNKQELERQAKQEELEIELRKHQEMMDIIKREEEQKHEEFLINQENEIIIKYFTDDEMKNFDLSIIKKALFKNRELKPDDYLELVNKSLEKLNQQFNPNSAYKFETFDNFKDKLSNLRSNVNIINENLGTNLKVSDGLNDLIADFKRLKLDYNNTKRGVDGERYVYDEIKFHESFEILHNVNVKFGYGTSSKNQNQMDLVVICQQGIYILEVKNFKGDKFILKNDGTIEGRKSNVIKQTEQHEEAILAVLPNSIKDVLRNRPKSIIINANPNSISV